MSDVTTIQPCDCLRVANFREMKFGTPRGWGMGIGEGVSSRLGGMGERRELPQRGPGRKTPVVEGKLGILGKGDD